MPLRKACGHAPHATTYDQDDVLKDEAMVSLVAKIDMLATQMAKLLAKRHRTIERKDKSSENFANPLY